MTALGEMLTTDDVIAAAIPVGTVMAYGGDGGSAPSGWLYCRGQLVSTGGANAALYALIGHSYNGGTDPGSSQFRLPDFQKVFPVGVNDTSGSPTGPSSAAGSGPASGGSFSDGAWDHVHSNDAASDKLRLPSHYHYAGSLVQADHTHGAGSLWTDHWHSITTMSQKLYWSTDSPVGINRGASTGWSSNAGVTGQANGIGSSVQVQGQSASAGDLELTGQTAASNPPYAVVNYLVKL